VINITSFYKSAIGGVLGEDYFQFEPGSKGLKLRSFAFSDTTRKLVSGSAWLINSTNVGQLAQIAHVHGINTAWWTGDFPVFPPYYLKFIFYTTVAGDALSVKIVTESM
jgi:hypothetical protein